MIFIILIKHFKIYVDLYIFLLIYYNINIFTLFIKLIYNIIMLFHNYFVYNKFMLSLYNFVNF